ncbi:MAG: 30S ribosomal protein S16 [Anaerolineae bacterium]|nr:30S ribosomal protein S16 [Anaerolineae bacterium]
MLRIRLTRVGKKRQPYYRVVVADVEAKRDGRIVENIGHYTALTDPITFKIREERALYWLSVGAQPSDAVRRLLEKQGTMERLARLKAGEPMEALVAEIAGAAEAEPRAVPAPAAAPAVEEPAVAEAVEEVEEAAEDLGEQAQDVLEDAAEALGDAASQVAEAVGAAVSAVTSTEEE